MKLYELLKNLSTADLQEAEVQLIEYDPQFDVPSVDPVPPTYSIYWEHMTNGEVLGGHIEISEKLFRELELKYEPTRVEPAKDDYRKAFSN